MSKLSHAERIALNTFLSEYPQDKSYNEIMYLILKGHDDVLIWEPFQYHDEENIREYIDDLKEEINRAFKNEGISL